MKSIAECICDNALESPHSSGICLGNWDVDVVSNLNPSNWMGLVSVCVGSNASSDGDEEGVETTLDLIGGSIKVECHLCGSQSCEECQDEAEVEIFH